MGSPLRVLHVVVNMNRGGAETLLMNLFRNMDRTKIQFDFLTCKAGVFDEEISQLGGRIHRIPYVTEVGHFKYKQALEAFFSSHPEYKIVHAHMDKMSGLVLKAARKMKVPVRISHSHNTSSEGGMAAKLYKWYIGNLIDSNATNYFACSTKAAEWLFSHQSSTAYIVKNGIVLPDFHYSRHSRKQMRDELNLTDDHRVIGHIGRFAKQKNHPFLIDIFAEYSASDPRAVLLLVGDGPLKEEIVNKVKNLNLQDKVHFLGIRSDIPKLLQAFDLILFPSFHEGLPVSLIEAQGAGLPCLISDKISDEVDMGVHLIDYAPLSDKSIWLEKIKGSLTKQNERTIDETSLASKGYNIQETVLDLAEFYLSV